VLTGSKGRRHGVRIELTTEGNVDGDTLHRERRADEEERLGGFGCGGECPRQCPFYRLNNGRGGSRVVSST
jgi:hypothetical protein